GRLFYRHDLSAVRAGEVAADAPDAALVVAEYRRGGPAALLRLEGDFALVLVDRARPGLLALRDPFGAWPLFAATGGGTARVSTRLLALADEVGAEVDPSFLGRFLMSPHAFAEVSHEQTAFHGVRRVLAGQLLHLTPDGGC